MTGFVKKEESIAEKENVSECFGRYIPENVKITEIPGCINADRKLK